VKLEKNKRDKRGWKTTGILTSSKVSFNPLVTTKIYGMITIRENHFLLLDPIVSQIIIRFDLHNLFSNSKLD